MSNSPDRAKAQEPSSTSSITFPATADSREVTDLRRRDEWVRRVAEIGILSPINRVVGMRLGHYYNGKTGQLNPSYATLARASGTTERTAQKAVAALKALGWIAPTRTTGGRHDATNDFVLLIPAQRVSGRTPVQVKSKRLTGVQLGSARVSSSCADGCPGGHPNRVMKESGIEGSALPPRSADDEPPGPAIATVAKTADDDRVDPALENEIPDQKRETPDGARLDRNSSDEDQNRTAGLEAASYRTGRAAQTADGATVPAETNHTEQWNWKMRTYDEASLDEVSRTPGYRESEFQLLRDVHLNPDDETGSRIAYCAALRENPDDVRGTLNAMLRYADWYREQFAGRPPLKKRTIAEFIAFGTWRKFRQPPGPAPAPQRRASAPAT